MFECPPAIAREMARLQFTCLDEVWVNRTTLYRFQCVAGHVMELKANILPLTRNCRLCREEARMLRLQQKAEDDGSICLDGRWAGSLAYYRFRCRHDPEHEWSRTYHSAVRDAVCPHCVDRARARCRVSSVALQRLQERARSHGGECLSTTFYGYDFKYRFRCAKGHTWQASTTHILNNNTWCRRCVADELMLGMEALREAARLLGGKCLSRVYRGAGAKHKWQCGKGHTWEAVHQSVRKGHWCPQCAKDSQWLTVEDMQRDAAVRGGQCLSNEYKGVAQKYQWLCERGHTWRTRYSAIRAGQWCPSCRYMSRTRVGSDAWKRYQPDVPRE